MELLGFQSERDVNAMNIAMYLKMISPIIEKTENFVLNDQIDESKKEIIFSHKRIICLMMDFIQLCIKHNAYLMKGLMGKGDESLLQHPLHDCKFFATNDKTKEVEEVDMLNYRDIKLTDVEKKYLTLEKVTANYASIQRGRIMELNKVEKLFDEKTLTPIS